MTTRLLRPTLSVVTGLVLATSLFAQDAAKPAPPQVSFPDPSPNATVKQRVGITDIEIVFGRPSMRGRQVFGGLEPYGKVWRTGANSATKVTFSTAVKFGGADIPAGTYALFTIPERAGDWTVILNKVPGQWGAYSYDEKNDVTRVKATAVPLAQPLETFSIFFGDLANESSATLNLMWENVRVPVKIEVDLVGMLVPQVEALMASDAPKKPWFRAAMFYYENNLDLKKAAAWVDAGLVEQPAAFYMVYRKGLILEKAGDKAGAREAAMKSLEAAKTQQGSLRDEYVRLNEALLARLK